jgi:hypothetical protein
LATVRDTGERDDPLGIRTPSPLAWVNPFVAQADVLCGTESSFGGGWCRFINSLVPAENGIIIRDGGVVPVAPPPIPGMANRGVGVAVGAAEPAVVNDAGIQAFGPERDRLWTRGVALWLGLSAVFIFLSVQAVSPTRRWQFRRGTRAPTEPAP